MRLSKAERETVRQKFGGRCAYCGAELGARWHADHLQPVIRQAGQAQPERPEHQHVDNMMPACAPCNISKGRQTLEGWRTWLQGHISSLNAYHPIYRLAKAYGLIRETGLPVVFHFETVAESRSAWELLDSERPPSEIVCY